MRPIVIIGESPGPRPEYTSIIFPLPHSSAGGKLRAMTRLSVEEYNRKTKRINLLPYDPGKVWPLSMAHLCVQNLLLGGLLRDERVLLVGAKVRNAFGMQQYPWLKWTGNESFQRAAIPHPSNRNFWYDSTTNRSDVVAFLKDLFDEG
jgi:hypothetical protein